MNKVLCLLVVVAVISKAYAEAPAVPAAASAPGAELNKAADTVKGAAGNPGAVIEPFVKLEKTASDEGEKAVHGFLGALNSAGDAFTKH